jgi:hypothetical protein
VARTVTQQATLKRLQRLSRLLDSSIKIPLINRRIGLDPIIGLIPGFGDAVTLLPAGYIIFEAYRLGVPRGTVLRMIANVGLETLAGTVPILGDLFDAAYKANTRNLYLIERHVGPLGELPLKRPSSAGLTWLLILLLLLCAAGVALAVWLGLWLFRQFLQIF